MLNRLFVASTWTYLHDWLTGNLVQTSNPLLKQRLAGLGFDDQSEKKQCDMVVEHCLQSFVCPIDETPMTDPIVLVTQEELAEFRIDEERSPSETNFDLHRYLQRVDEQGVSKKVHFFDRSIIDKFWSETAHYRENPSTRATSYVIPFTPLKQQITAIITMLEFMVRESHREPVNNNKFIADGSEIPAKFKCGLKGNVMSYPVKLDGGHTYDLFALMSWWQENPNNLSRNPGTQELIKEIHFLDDLYYQLREFSISNQIAIQRGALEKMLADVEVIANTKKDFALTDAQRAAMQDIATYKCLYSERIMIHPVVLDGMCTVDLNELKNWWARNHNLRFRNPITGDVITSMQYNVELRENIATAASTKRSDSQSSTENDDNTAAEESRPGGSPRKKCSASGFVPFYARQTAMLHATLIMLPTERNTPAPRPLFKSYSCPNVYPSSGSIFSRILTPTVAREDDGRACSPSPGRNGGNDANS